MRRILYTLGRPLPELDAIRHLIYERSGLDTTDLPLYSPTAKLQYGRVWYAVVEPTSQRALIFTIGHTSPNWEFPAETGSKPLYLSEGEVKALFKLAQTLFPGRVFLMLSPVRLWEDEIQSQVLLESLLSKKCNRI